MDVACATAADEDSKLLSVAADDEGKASLAEATED